MPDGGRAASLYATTAISSSDVWAVGSYYDGAGDTALAQHWDGTAWRTVPVPPAGSAAYLTDVAGLSPSDVWAVGSWSDGAGTAQTLAMHWDGTAWRLVATPHSAGIAHYLASVTAVAHDDVWAVGYEVTTDAIYQTLAMHWNGSAWSVAPTPDPGAQDNLLEGVAAHTTDDVWTVGFFEAAPDRTETLIAHWDGVSWSRTTTPNPGAVSNSLNAVHARARDDVWAVGTWHDGHDNVSLTMRWDGAQWLVVPSPNIAESGNVLNDVQAVSDGDAWAVGYYYNTVGDRVQETLTLHWDGSLWSLLPSPNASRESAFNYLQGVTTLRDGEAWTVGLAPTGSIVERSCAVVVRDTGFSPRGADIPRGEAAVWFVPLDAAHEHAIVDASGMALYDSGTRAAGASFSYRFDFAGSYAVSDPTNASVGMLRVPMLIAPASGDAQTRFVVTWASERAAPGFVFDVQIRRPGASGFEAWQIGATQPGSTFVPDGGSGAYAFRARLRKLDGQHASWSTPFSIHVS